MLSTTVTFLLFFIVSTLLASVQANFDADDLDDGSFNLRQGSESICPRRIRIRTTSLTLIPSNIEFDGNICTRSSTSSATLSSVPPGGTTASNAVRFFSSQSSRIGNFLAGRVQGGSIVCGNREVKVNTELIFLEPNRDLDNVAWTSVFGSAVPIASNGPTAVDFDDDTRYLLLGKDCFYSDTTLVDRVKCFPASARISVDETTVAISQLSTGTSVHVGEGIFSPVFSWTHRDPHARSLFVEMRTKTRHLRASPGHFVYVRSGALPAKEVRVGMALRLADGDYDDIVSISHVKDVGLYNPQTLHGDVVVNGFVTTTYTTAIQPAAAHALLAPVRAAFIAARAILPSWTLSYV